MSTHDIKILPHYFEDVLKHIKTFELRKDDQNYQVGDIVNLHEFDGQNYTGQIATIQISYVLRNVSKYGLQDGYCIFTWKEVLSTELLSLV